MNRNAILDELHRVCGRFMGLQPIAFPKHPAVVDMLVKHARHIIDNSSLSPLQHALLLRKAAVYLIRTGILADTKANLTLATDWFFQNPDKIPSRIGFGHAAHLEGHMLLAQWRRIPAEADDGSADLQAPITPKIMLLRHDGHDLELLTHARHLVEAGRAAGNCLIITDGSNARPNPVYWHRVKDGTMSIFTLSRDQRINVIFAVMDGKLIEMETVEWSHRLAAVMVRCADAVQSYLGPVTPAHDGMFWPCPPPPPNTRNTPHPGQMEFFQDLAIADSGNTDRKTSVIPQTGNIAGKVDHAG